MDTLQCAIVLAKLERFDWEVAQRVEVGRRYNRLMDAAGIRRVSQRDDRVSVFAQYTILVDERDVLLAALKQAGIPTAVHYPLSLDQQPAYAGACRSLGTPFAAAAAKQVVSLPMHPLLDERDQLRIVDAIRG